MFFDTKHSQLAWLVYKNQPLPRGSWWQQQPHPLSIPWTLFLCAIWVCFKNVPTWACQFTTNSIVFHDYPAVNSSGNRLSEHLRWFICQLTTLNLSKSNLPKEFDWGVGNHQQSSREAAKLHPLRGRGRGAGRWQVQMLTQQFALLLQNLAVLREGIHNLLGYDSLGKKRVTKQGIGYLPKQFRIVHANSRVQRTSRFFCYPFLEYRFVRISISLIMINCAYTCKCMCIYDMCM